ncbi:CoA transferase [Craurococcus roseus]|uniref:CoA transferase n=1 Tax=Craurococcus roseus TaxID=77585 RepID=A0ABP3QLC9_9PROT
MDSSRPFDGVRVVDATHVLAGPFAAYQLALLGADVVKVEHPEEPDQSRGTGADLALNRLGMGTYALTQNANKRSVTLDLKREGGKEVMRRLLAGADVLVENYRPGAFEALGFGPEAVAALNPRLIYCSISAFGQNGPRRGQTAYDHVVQATSGVMAATGTPEANPIKFGAPVIDYATGTMGAFALAAALFQRERTGHGQRIDLAMLDVAMMMQASHLTALMRTGKGPKPHGNTHPYATNCAYGTKDGSLVMLGASNLRQQRRLWTALGRPEVAKADNEARLAAHEAEAALLREIMRTRTADAWEEYLQARHVPAARVRSTAEAMADPHLAERGHLLHRFPDGAPGVEGAFGVPVAAFGLAHGGPRVDAPPPRLGADTDAVLAELGYAPGDIAALRASGAV